MVWTDRVPADFLKTGSTEVLDRARKPGRAGMGPAGPDAAGVAVFDDAVPAAGLAGIIRGEFA